MKVFGFIQRQALRRRTVRASFGLLTALLAVVLAACSCGGQKIDVGDGRQLYLTCRGGGSPTVVMEAGGAGHSGSWRFVQPDVSEFTRVCVYDRAGTGRSESVRPHGTTQAITEELHALLGAAGVNRPYVLVGHSLGGIIVRQFATDFPNEIKGMGLVDSSQGDVRAGLQGVLTPEQWEQYGPHDDGFVLPEGTELLGPDLADIPLVVLTVGLMGTGPPSDVAERIQEHRLEMHRELLTLSTNSIHMIAEKSDHGILRNQPEIVVDAISQVVDAVRNHATLDQAVSWVLPE